MDKKKIALIVVVLFLLIGLGSFVFANPDQDNNLEGPGVSEDGGSGNGEVIDGTEPTATPTEENDGSATETTPITTYGNGGNGTGTGAGNNGTTGGVGNTDMSQYDDARRIIEELENRVNSMKNKDDSNNAVDYRTDTGIIDMVNNLPDGTVKDELKDRLDSINKVLDDTKAPVITGINNGDVTKENVSINVEDENDVTITATLDGEEIDFTTPLTEEGHYVVTVTDKNFNTTTVEFTIDKTPIALDWLYVLNNSGTDYKVIGDGQKLYVELVFSEEFTSIPMIQIGNAEAVEMSCHWTNWQTEKQYFKCDATITIDGSTMGLENGKEVPVKITNVLDAAGNETVLTNENITETEKYGHVIYDNQAPEMEVLRLTNVSRKDENGAWLQVAKAGDIVRVIVQFNENLATLPTLKVNGTEVGVMKYDSNMQSYTYDYKVTENDVNGVMQIEISNYADAAGNVGVTLTNDDINHETQNQVVIDTVAPEYAAMGIFNWTNDNDGTDRTYATKNEHIRLYVSFPEMLATNPKVDIYGMDGKVTTLDLSYSEAAKFYFVEFDTTDEFALPEGKINFKVYGYADEAGNVGADLTQDMTTSNEYPQVIYDSINPVLEGLTDGMYTNQPISLKISDTNWDYIHVNQVGVKEFDEHREWTGLYDDGVYEFQAFDKAGNASEVITVTKDSINPEISVKDEYIGDLNKNVFSNVSFKLYDNTGVSAYKINDGDYKPLTVSNWSDANFQNIKNELVYGKNTITLRDVAGNETTYTFTYDNVAPTITVKDGYVGDLEKKVFSNVSFSLYDEYEVVAYKINEGEYGEFTANSWSDANFQNIVSRLVYGKNTITLKDVAGNEAVYEFVYDNVQPTITVKEGYVGSLDQNIFSNVSFSLYDEYEVVAYKINDGEYGEFTANNWSDANFQNIVSRLIYGKNTITLKDVAGNEATYEFTYDNIAPVVLENNSTGSNDIFSLVNLKLYDANGITSLVINGVQYPHTGTYIDINDGYIYTFPEGENTIEFTDIAGNKTVYTFTVDKTAPEVKFPATHNSNADYKGWKTLTITISDTKLSEVYYTWANTNKYVNATTQVPAENITDNGDGTYTVKVPTVDGRNRLNIKAIDVAGNVTEVYSTSGAYNIDLVAPTVAFPATHNSNASYKNWKTLAITISDRELSEVYYTWANTNKYVNATTQVPAENITDNGDGTYTVNVPTVNGRNRLNIKAVDAAGNVTEVYSTSGAYNIDNEDLVVTVSKSNNDKSTNQDVVVTLVGNKPISAEGWTQVSDNTIQKVYSENGKYSVVATDKNGNQVTVNFEVKRIDKVAPEATVVKSNNDKSTNQDVTVTIVANEAIYKPEGWTEVTTNKEHEFTKVYSENGKYSVVITDKAGNETTINFEVKRIDKVAPVMTVISPNRYEIEQGSVYVDKGYSAWDAVDKDVTNLVQISYRFIAAGTGDYVSVPEIDTNKIGQYVVTYTAYDKAGNSSQSTRVVEIVPKTEG